MASMQLYRKVVAALGWPVRGRVRVIGVGVGVGVTMSLPPDEVGEAEGGAAQHAIVTALLLRCDAGPVRVRVRG